MALCWLWLNQICEPHAARSGKAASVGGKHIKPGVSRPPSFHFLQHCRKLLWIDTVGLHHCLGNRVGQDVLERWFAMTPIQNHSLPRWSQTATACCACKPAADLSPEGCYGREWNAFIKLDRRFDVSLIAGLARFHHGEEGLRQDFGRDVLGLAVRLD
jgi:hypothetical protein